MIGRRIHRDIAVWSALGAVYFAAGKLGLKLAFVHASATAVWPPTGIALAALLLLGLRAWPGILLGAFLVNVTTAGTVATSGAIAVGNTLEALIGAALVNRFANGRHAFRRAEGVLRFCLFAALASTVVSATLGPASLSVSGAADWRDYRGIWLTWWVGDAVAAVVVTPVLVLWSTPPWLAGGRRQALEAAAVLATLIFGALVVFAGWSPFTTKNYPLEFLCIPPLIWAAVRFGPREAATGTLALSAIAIWGTLHGFGPFARASHNESLLLLQAFMGAVGMMALAIGAVVSERRDAEHLLHGLNDTLEQRVRERTAELGVANAALRASEGRLSGIVEIAQDAIITVDERQHITLFNQGAERIFGYTAPEALGQPLHLLLPARVVAAHAEHVTHFARSPDTARLMGERREILGRRKDGSEFPAEASISRLVHDKRTVFTAILRDVTERKRLEEQLRQAQKLEGIGRLAGGIAHDFNNLLTAILGYTDLLLAGLSEDDPRASDMREIRRAAASGAALTRQLLAFSRKQILQPALLDLNLAVLNQERLLRRLIGENIAVVLQLEPALGRVHADPTQIDQVIVNLAVNARDAMPHGGTLTIATAHVDVGEAAARANSWVVPGRYVRLRINDTGHGMTPEVQAHLFEPFYTTKASGQGTGLGLSTVYGIVKQSGGFISVESTPGTGTTFLIDLPRVEARAPATEAPRRQLVSTAGTETILLVEDDDHVRDLARRALEQQGYTVIVARDPREALLTYTDHGRRIALVLTDVVMPGMSGAALAERLTRVRPDLKVLYMSGYTEDAIVHHGVLRTGVAFLPKPFTPETLTRKVRDFLDTET